MSRKNKPLPLLTVAIPSYRRPETLERIIIQLKKEKNQDFVLLICDDSVDQSVQKMIKKYQKSMPQLRYVKNKVNLGFNENVLQLYELTETRYLWFLCDDDTVLEGCIDSIVSSLEKHQPSVAVFNCSWINPYGQLVTAGTTKDIIYTKPDQLTSYHPLMRMTFLSILVLEKRISTTELKKLAYKDNIFIQLTLGLLVLSDKFKFVEIGKSILHRNVGFKYGEFFKFFIIDEIKAVRIVDHIFDNEKFMAYSYAKYGESLQLYLSQKLGLFKYTGSPTKETIFLLWRYFGLASILFLLFKPLYILIPRFVLEWLYYRKVVSLVGKEKADDIIKKNIDRAYRDERKTGFTTYR